MTKVFMNMDLLAYRLEMKETLRQVLGQNYITGAPQPFVAETVLAQEHLLPPPAIGFILLDGYTGQGDDYIALTASHDFGIHSMRITIVDDSGFVIETGEMWPFLEDPNAWEYLPQVCVPFGTSVTVHITAMDCMGGIGRACERKITG
jgi:hypothetical protein